MADECSHPSESFKRRKQSNGVVVVGIACDTCYCWRGAKKIEAPPLETLDWYDPAKRDAWCEAQWASTPEQEAQRQRDRNA